MSDEYNFEGNDDEFVVIRTRRGIAVYRNENGDVVIRQDGVMGDDAVIVVTPQDVKALAAAIRDAV